MTNEEAVKIMRRIQDPEAWEPQITRAAFEALDMAIEALGRQQAAGSGDLISRQEAIEVAKAHWYKPDIAGELEKLPSAGPTFDARDTQYNLPIGTDYISRQQTKDAIDKYLVGRNLATDGTMMARLINMSVIERLPSAKPEIIYCKDCKHFEYDHVENVNGIPLIVAHEICMRWSDGVKTSENGYCFLGKRRERQHE